MDLKEYFHSIDLEEIYRLIQDKQEEHLYLEFKTTFFPNNNDNNKDDDRKNFSKALSGFANSGGGIVIWGIDAKKNSAGQDVAKAKKPIKQLTKFLNILNRQEGQAVIPPVIGVLHEKIEVSEDEGFIKSFIPASDNIPHMAIFAGKHYYKRSGDSFYVCEHMDISDMFSRKRSPKLEVKISKYSKEDKVRSSFWYFVVSIENNSNVIAKFPYLAFNFSNGNFIKYEYGLDGNRSTGLYIVKNNIKFRHNYSGKADIVIYPSAQLDVDMFSCETPKDVEPPEVSIHYLVTAENAESLTGIINLTPDKFKM